MKTTISIGDKFSNAVHMHTMHTKHTQTGSRTVGRSRQRVQTERRDATGRDWEQLILKCSESCDWTKNRPNQSRILPGVFTPKIWLIRRDSTQLNETVSLRRCNAVACMVWTRQRRDATNLFRCMSIATRRSSLIYDRCMQQCMRRRFLRIIILRKIGRLYKEFPLIYLAGRWIHERPPEYRQ